MNFQSSPLASEGTNYGFTAQIQEALQKGGLTSGTFKTLGGYHVASQELPGWLSIMGNLIAESSVPIQLLQLSGNNPMTKANLPSVAAGVDVAASL